MKKILIFMIFLCLTNLIFSQESYNEKIDKRILTYLELKDKILPHGLELKSPLNEQSGMLEVNIYLKENRVKGIDNKYSNNYYSKVAKPIDEVSRVENFKRDIERLNGLILNQEDNKLFCSLYPSTITNIAKSDLVKTIKLPLRPYEEEIPISEGVNASAANRIQPLIPFRGKQRVKVCILDGGFKGYKGLLGNKLPQNVTVKSFTANNDLEAGSVHGTACAEIVHAMAPDAELYLVNSDTYANTKKAVEWLISQNVDIVSYSMGWYNIGPGNGKDVICKLTEKFSNAGILMVTSAGNSAYSHWSGVFTDKDGDGFHDFQDGSNMIKFKVSAYKLSGGFLRWDDWVGYDDVNGFYGGATQDYDLFLYIEESPGKYVEVPDTNNVQKAGGDYWPTESNYQFYAEVESNWAIKIRKTNATRNCKLDLFLPKAYKISERVYSGSLTSPADSNFTLTVGAISCKSKNYHYYSSQGPTTDGRLKPEISGYAGVSTQSYGTKSFYGTSSACPHVAGAIALLMSKTPFNAFDVVEIIKARAVDLQEQGPDNLTGYGALMLVK